MARRRGEGGCTKIQEHMSTNVLSSKNLHTTTPFRLFSIVVPIYYNSLKIYKINTTLFYDIVPLKGKIYRNLIMIAKILCRKPALRYVPFLLKKYTWKYHKLDITKILMQLLLTSCKNMTTLPFQAGLPKYL